MSNDEHRPSKTIGLTRAALRRANSLIEAITVGTDDLIAAQDLDSMLGHELRNPLSAIRHAADLIKLVGNSDPRLERASEVLERQTAHMAGLVDGLLEVSRIARGKIALDRHVRDLRDLCEEVIEDRKAAATRASLTVTASLPDQPVWALVDPVRLVQIIDNLLSNAIKFTPGPGHIAVQLDSNDHRARMSVRDTGVGIHADKLESIFEPFHQEPQDVARDSGGLGLGLAVARGLVELHGGTIEARSPGPGQGSELVVELPVVREPAAVEARQHHPPAPARRHILLVEDNDDAAQMLGHVLQLQGHVVSIASTALRALEILDQNRAIDVVLCDIGLPDMSGYELAATMRLDARLRELPLVALTGYGQPDDRMRTDRAGFDAHLVKPVDVEALGAVLSQFGQ